MADYPLPPWLAPVSPVAPFLQAVSTGAGIAAQQNQNERSSLEMQLQQEQENFKNAQVVAQIKMQAAAQQRQNELANAQLVGLQMKNQQAARDMAAQFAQQQEFQRLRASGVPDVQAYAQSAGLGPAAASGRFYAQLMGQQAIQNRLVQGTALRAGLNPEGASLEDIADAVSNRNKPAAVRKADAAVQAYSDVNPNATQQELDSIRDRLIRDPNATTAPTDAIKEIRAQDIAAQSLGQALQHIQQFEAKFGPGSFDKYTGPIGARLNKFAKNYTGFTTEDAALANQIFSEVAKTVNAYRNKQFGSQLTQFEGGEFKRFIDSPESQNFKNSISAAVGSIGDDLIRNLENYKDAPNIQPAIRARYQGLKPGEWFMKGGGTSAGPVQVNSQSEYDKLPSGALYIDSSGKTKRKK